MNENIALITGCSSGIGFATSLELARNGYFVYATMRNLQKSGPLEDIIKQESLPIKILQVDVSSQQSIDAAIETIMQEKNRIDVIINNAGFMAMGSLEDISMEKFTEQLETDFIGPIRLLKKVVPIMRQQGSGHIINISSIAGRMGFPLSSAYTSSKFALEGFTETLRAELKPYNIHTTLIQPGVVKTNFFENMKRHAPNLENSAYRDLTQGMIDITEKILTNAKIDGSHVAQEIKNILDTKPDYMRKPVGKDAEIALKKRNQLDDKDFEKWLQGEFMEILKRGGS